MARSTNTAASADSKSAEAETVNNKNGNATAAGTEKPSAAPEKKPDSKKPLSFGDDDIVKVKHTPGKSVTGCIPGKVVTFGSDGTAEVSGKEARYFLSIPGYELIK
nr:MAG TPA: hypothetical protein [Bacteriophage sp.]